MAIVYLVNYAKLFWMKTWRHHLPSPRTVIFLVIAALFCLTVFQSHIHVHAHDAHDASHHSLQQHDHLMAVSIIDDLSVIGDQHDSMVIDAKPTGLILKQFSKDSFNLLLIFLVVLFFLNPFGSARRILYIRLSEKCQTRHHYFTPQLRAPPQAL